MADLAKFLKRKRVPPPEESDAPPPVEHPPKRGKRSARRMRNKVAATAPLVVPAFEAHEAAPPQAVDVRVATLTELVRQFPHLITDTGDAAADAAAAADRSARAEEEPPVVAPWLDRAFTRMIEELPEVRLLSDNVAPAQAMNRLMQRQNSLPLLRVEDENFLLQESGDFVMPDGHLVRFPPCRRLDRCAARVWNIPGAPDHRPILTQLMYEAEVKALLNEGTPPLESRCCILCCRMLTYELIMSLRCHSESVRLSETIMIQLYRNIAGRVGGYRNEDCVLPQTGVWEGFLDPIAIFKPLLLQWEFDPTVQRWRINQDLMVFRPMCDGAGANVPRPFETPQDFRLRSEATLRHASTHSPLNRVQRLIEHLAPASLRANLLRMIPPADWVVSIIRRGGYDAAVVLDALLLGNTIRLNVDDVICEDSVSLPQCHVALLQSSLWVSRTTAQGGKQRLAPGMDWVRALSHLMGKGAPLRCMTRKFPAVCLELLEQFKPLDNCMRQWALCSMLGNYRAAHARGDVRPYHPETRKRLYTLFNSDEGWPVFKDTLRGVLVFIVREMVVAEVLSVPSMVLDLEKRINWPAFRSAVGCTMAAIRSVVNHAVEHTGTWPSAASLAAIVERGHHDVLAVAHRRPLQPLVRTVTGQALRTVMANLPPLPTEVRDVIDQWTRALPHGPAELGVQFMPWLHAFGVAGAARSELWKLCLNYERELIGKRELHDHLVRLAQEFPRAISIVHAWCQSYRESQRCVQWTLPQHYTVNQAAAIRGRLHMGPNDPLPDYTVRVRLCRGCACMFDGAYIWVDATATKPVRAVRKILRGARADLRDDTIICDQCEYDQKRSVSVQLVPLLGTILACRRGLVLLCPQPGCGYPMVLDPRCIYTEYGVACASCTMAATERPPFATLWDKTCHLCHKRAREPRLFPPDITVCGYHVREDVVDDWDPNATREQVLARLKSYSDRLRDALFAMGKNRRKRQQQRNRARGNMTARQAYYADRG